MDLLEQALTVMRENINTYVKSTKKLGHKKKARTKVGRQKEKVGINVSFKFMAV